jgi:hypothetical protein
MMKTTTVCTLLAAFVSLPALAQGPLVRFDGGIGNQPLRGGPATNVVQGVNPAGIPWVITRLNVDVMTDGRISVDGRGLLLAGGNGIGSNGGQSVGARLFCGTVPHNSIVVPLESNGDFRIDDILVPLPPNPCNNPVLLIVNAGGSWFAAGIPKQ